MIASPARRTLPLTSRAQGNWLLALDLVDVLWLILGVGLVVIVALVLVAFFLLRPRAVRQLRASAVLLAKETHGRKPQVLAAAQCASISLPAKQGMIGVGMLALTDHALVFSAANPDRTLIVPRNDITSVRVGAADGSGAGKVPQLTVAWRSAAGSNAQVVFATAQPEAFTAPLAEFLP